MPGTFQANWDSPRSPNARHTILTRKPFLACSAIAPPARQTKSPGWADTTSPVFMGWVLALGWNFLAVEFEKPGGISDQYLLLNLRLRREQRNEVDQIAVVRHHLDVGMRPIGTPDHPVRRGLDDAPGERHRIDKQRTGGGYPL